MSTTSDVQQHGAPASPPSGLNADSEPGAAPRNKRQRKQRDGQLLRFILRLGVLVSVLAVWAFITAMKWVPPLYLPSPAAVWDAFVQSNSCRPISQGSARIVCGEQEYFMWEHLLNSLKRMGVGVGAAIVVGPVLGFAMGSARWVRTAVEPYLNFLRALPPLGYIGLVIIWVGIADPSKWLLLFLAAFPPITIATINGIASVSNTRIHAAQSLGGNNLQIAFQIVLPSVLPELLSGIRIAVGFAWTTVVAAELNNGLPGIGGLAYISGQQLQTPLTIACIIVIGLAAVGLDALIDLIARALVPWRGKA